MERVILHCDLNNFFASVAMHDNSELKDKPIAVCGSVEERHGIILAKNELAKAYGVATAEPIFAAQRKCPMLTLVKPDYKRYTFFSKEARKIYEQYTDQVEPFGIDECWLDISGSVRLFGSGECIADKIRNEIKEKLGLTVSIGVSFNKIFAKLGSDLKKPDAISIISNENYKAVVWPLKISCLLGVGHSTEKKLLDVGIFTIGDIAKSDKQMLHIKLGKMGEQLWECANGIDSSVVANIADRHIPKSIGRSVTSRNDLLKNEEVWIVLLRLSEDISAQLRAHGLETSAIQIHVRTSDLHVREFQTSLSHPTAITRLIAEKGMELFKLNYNWHKPLRSVGIRAINLYENGCGYQFSLFENYGQENRLQKIDTSIDNLRARFGNDSIGRASLLKEKSCNMKIEKAED